MKISFFGMFVLLFAWSPAASQNMATQECGTGEVRLEGSINNFGCNYREIVLLEKIGRSAGHHGDWRMKSFQQIITYPMVISPPIETTDVQLICPGVFMKVHAFTRGNQVITETLENNVVFTIRNDVFHFKANMKPIGWVQGSELRFKWDPENNLLPELSGSLKGDRREIAVRILYPDAEHRRFVFDEDVPGKLTITAKAEAEPAVLTQDIQWSFEKIEGATMTADPPDLRGPEVAVTFTGLPESTYEFGFKRVRAILDLDGCRAEARQTIEIFYPILGRNNPSAGTYDLPNWFYYWRQTPAARPDDVGVVLEYRGRVGDYCRKYPGVPMYYTPIHSGGMGRIDVCDLANIDGSFFSYTFPKLSRDLNAVEDRQVGRFEGFRTIRYIDLFAAALLHEYQHKKFDEGWRSKPLAEVLEEDRDQDGIPDMIERRGDMRFIVGMKQSWFHDDPKLKIIEYDEEWLAYENMNSYVDGIYNKYDWAKPGKQWPEL
jgi:hypothetical protein